LDLHFVNYNRIEPAQPKSPGTGIKDEQPVAAPAIEVDCSLPAGVTARRVVAFTPETPDGQTLPAEIKDGRARFTVPSFLVYCLVRVK
jgi:hypothetical protein